jgi:hypothetical protein
MDGDSSGLIQVLFIILPEELSKPTKNPIQDNRSPYHKSNEAHSVTPNCSVMYTHKEILVPVHKRPFWDSIPVKKLDFSSEKGNLRSVYIGLYCSMSNGRIKWGSGGLSSSMLLYAYSEVTQ